MISGIVSVFFVLLIILYQALYSSTLILIVSECVIVAFLKLSRRVFINSGVAFILEFRQVKAMRLLRMIQGIMTLQWAAPFIFLLEAFVPWVNEYLKILTLLVTL